MVWCSRDSESEWPIAMHTYISDFRSIRPRYSLTSEQAMKNAIELRMLLNRKRVEAGLDTPLVEKRLEQRIHRFGLANSKIKSRGVEVKDYTLSLAEHENELSLFSTEHVPVLEKRNAVYRERVNEVFKDFYPENNINGIPQHLIHVTCTGYMAPSPAQVKASIWSNAGQGPVQVTHAYHMGCYASFPALRIGNAFALQGAKKNDRVDIVHTEICSLHTDILNLAAEQIVVQSLFADGHIRYSVGTEAPTTGFQIFALNEETLPHSTDFMTWEPTSTHFAMTLSRELPTYIRPFLKPFIAKLMKEAGISIADPLIYAIHPGGPKLIDSIEEALELSREQTEESHEVFMNFGNMSSATLPHIWEKILQNPTRKNGTHVVSLAFGPGLTIAGGVFRVVK